MIVSGILFFSPENTVSDDDTIYGKYYSEYGYLELMQDGRYAVVQDNAFEGTYTYDETTVTLVYTFGKFELQRDGNTLIDHEGDQWIKT